VKEQKEPPAGDSTFLPKLYFKKACQRTLDNTLFRYETIIYFLQDSDFNEENQLALYQIAINQQQTYKHKIEQENKPDNLPSLLERLDFRFETLKSTFLSNITPVYPEMKMYLVTEEDIRYPEWKMPNHIEKRRKDLELKLVTNGRGYGPLFKKNLPSRVWIRILRRNKILFNSLYGSRKPVI